MPYTLAKGFAWIALALMLGIVIGWLLRSIAAKRQVARARSHHIDAAEMERLRGRIANLEPVVAERDRLRAELDECRAAAEAPVVALQGESIPSGEAPSTPSTPDLAEASSVLGHPIELDDLKVVEGVGPKIEALCNGIGIRTWFDLSTTEVSLLRTMLADAGPRFRSHDPATWPQQAALLAHGRWSEFRALADEIRGDRPVD